MTAADAFDEMMTGRAVAHESFAPTEFCRVHRGAVYRICGAIAIDRCEFVVPSTLRTVIPGHDLADGWRIYTRPTLH